MGASESGLVGQRVGNYLVEAELASGGQGSVFRARHLVLGRFVALKVLHVRDADFLYRFEREGRLLANLTHPLLPRVHEVVQLPDDRPALSMELVHGDSLENRITRQGAPPLGWTLELFAQLADCLAACHQAGIVHRDLKPDNILLEHQTERPLLVDFGLARSAHTASGYSLTQTGEILGTPAYMAPEQASGERHEVGPASDLYSLGATLFFALVERPPFKGATSMELVLSAMRQTAPDIRTIDKGVPEPLAELLNRLLAKSPEERPGSAREVAEELSRITAELGLSGAKQAQDGVGRAIERELEARKNPRRLTARLTTTRGSAALIPALAVAALGLAATGVVFWNRAGDSRPKPAEPIDRSASSPSPGPSSAESAAPPAAEGDLPRPAASLSPAVLELVSDPKADPRALIALVRRLREEANERELLPALDAITARFPTRARDMSRDQLELLAQRARARAEARDEEELAGAIEDAEAILRRNKGPLRLARFAKGLALGRQGRWEAAQTLIRGAELVSDRASMVLGAELALRQNAGYGAQARVAQISRAPLAHWFFEPNKPALLLAESYLQGGDEAQQRARELLAEVLTLDPDNAAALRMFESLE